MFETTDGRRLYKAETSTHHLIFERRDYQTPTEKKFRNMGGLVMRLSNHAHRELHANVPPPPKPNPNLMRDIYLYSRSRDYDTAYSLAAQITCYVGQIALNSHNEQNAEDATALFDNLIQQAVYIEEGQLKYIGEQHGKLTA